MPAYALYLKSGPQRRTTVVNDAFGPFLGAWTLMMAAMMLPSATPMILLHRLGDDDAGRMRSELRTGVFVGG